jgi:hypothetical protein
MEKSEEFRAAVAQLPQECWCIVGVLSNGGPFVSRRFDRLDQLERAAKMNALGASVVVKHQRIDPITLLWADCDE